MAHGQRPSRGLTEKQEQLIRLIAQGVTNAAVHEDIENVGAGGYRIATYVRTGYRQ